MNKHIAILTGLSLLLSASSFSVIAEQHQHHHKQQSAELVLNQGEKWRIDSSLHLGMSKIKQELQTNLKQIHHDKFTAKQYQTLALQLDQHLGFLFENCQLAPEADAQLHVLLARIIKGADKMKHAADKKQGAVLVIQALQDYPRYFNDANWQALAH